MQAVTAAMSVRLAHRPLFLAAAVCTVDAMLQPYPTVADLALYMVRAPGIHSVFYSVLGLTLSQLQGRRCCIAQS